MSHMPRFWREAGFKGWPKFLTAFIKNQPGKRFNVKELVEFFEPNSEPERNKIRGGISNALDRLKNKGVLDMIRQGRDGFYFLKPQETKWEKVIEQPSYDADELVPRSDFYKELNRKRIEHIGNTVLRRIDQGKEIPLEWIQEYNDLVK